jgi:rhodanese-related sulfurtransferase
MELINGDELKEKLDRGDDFKLVMVLSEWAFRAKHIPGSIHIDSLEKAKEDLSLDEEIIVYCAGPDCIASQAAYHMLVGNGFTHVKRFAGGLAEWEDAGYPLEGEMVETT